MGKPGTRISRMRSSLGSNRKPNDASDVTNNARTRVTGDGEGADPYGQVDVHVPDAYGVEHPQDGAPQDNSGLNAFAEPTNIGGTPENATTPRMPGSGQWDIPEIPPFRGSRASTPSFAGDEERSSGRVSPHVSFETQRATFIPPPSPSDHRNLPGGATITAHTSSISEFLEAVPGKPAIDLLEHPNTPTQEGMGNFLGNQAEHDFGIQPPPHNQYPPPRPETPHTQQSAHYPMQPPQNPVLHNESPHQHLGSGLHVQGIPPRVNSMGNSYPLRQGFDRPHTPNTLVPNGNGHENGSVGSGSELHHLRGPSPANSVMSHAGSTISVMTTSTMMSLATNQSDRIQHAPYTTAPTPINVEPEGMASNTGPATATITSTQIQSLAATKLPPIVRAIKPSSVSGPNRNSEKTMQTIEDLNVNSGMSPMDRVARSRDAASTPTMPALMHPANPPSSPASAVRYGSNPNPSPAASLLPRYRSNPNPSPAAYNSLPRTLSGTALDRQEASPYPFPGSGRLTPAMSMRSEVYTPVHYGGSQSGRVTPQVSAGFEDHTSGGGEEFVPQAPPRYGDVHEEQNGGYTPSERSGTPHSNGRHTPQSHMDGRYTPHHTFEGQGMPPQVEDRGGPINDMAYGQQQQQQPQELWNGPGPQQQPWSDGGQMGVLYERPMFYG